MLECLVGLMRTTKSEARRFQEVKGSILTSGRLVTHCLLQFGAFLAIPNPLGGQLVPGVNKTNSVLIIGVYTN